VVSAGLAVDTADPDALMAPTYNEGDKRRNLRPDDIAAACDIYPPGRVPETKDEGCSTSGAATRSNSAWGLPLLMLVLPVAAALRKRRNQRKLD
jgi:hypothetical protein